jgi:hypothetical protein
LELEIRAGDQERAKNVLLQAIGACPLVKGRRIFAHLNGTIAEHTTKDIYMQAFSRLRSAFSVHELKSLWEAMVERGLRIRRGLEEVIEGLDDGKEPHMKDEEADGVEDEIEYNSRELARLKPY